jgi:gamma-glutamylcyclotransferase (GGCT)/AIG2-like uncharacterized protein YtfP
MTDSDKLFVYGTLLQDADNPVADFLRQYSELIGRGFFKGELYDIGNYPGAVYKPDGPYRVEGDMLRLFDPGFIFNHLDYYEGIGPQFSEPHQYIRRVIPVYPGDGKNILVCWVYLYNWDTEGLALIRGGVYKY